MGAAAELRGWGNRLFFENVRIELKHGSSGNGFGPASARLASRAGIP
jgi:hypothetical protein